MVVPLCRAAVTGAGRTPDAAPRRMAVLAPTAIWKFESMSPIVRRAGALLPAMDSDAAKVGAHNRAGGDEPSSGGRAGKRAPERHDLPHSIREFPAIERLDDIAARLALIARADVRR